MPNNSANQNNKLDIAIKSALQTYFSGKASTVTSYNDTGMFDILPQHANFVSIIKNKIIVDKGLSTQKEVMIERGVLSVRSNKIDIYLGFDSAGNSKPESKVEIK
jgi:F0F1-type ATP synthase epsilon subunit